LKITFISDTHGLHKKLEDLSGDMVIHAGDISNRGTSGEIVAFLNWFETLDFEFKVFIAGNHDFFLEQIHEYELEKLIPKNVIYLNDSGTTINNLKLWGSPIQPWFHNWAFNRSRGVEIKKHWDLIPSETDILITHGPPFKILDQTTSGDNVGCKDLLIKTKTVKPLIHVFGHIHEDYGIQELNGIQFINASVLNEKYEISNSPIQIIL